MMAKTPTMKSVESLTHDEATRKNIPTAEHQSIMHESDKTPIRVAYERRNRDLDPQLVWRGKDEQDWSDLVVQAPPLYIQEKVHPKVLIDDLLRRTEVETKADADQFDLFADFNGLPNEAAKTEFYQHDAHWANRMILGDSLQVMASLAEREGLRGKVQCIYFDPPYGIKFNSNFQWSTTSRDVKDGKADHITREPEQVKAFRDTWRDGIHSYLTYLRDRLTVSRDLLADSGSIFVQIGDENVHRVRAMMDEVFGEKNFVSEITTSKTSGFTSSLISNVNDFVLWYSKKNDSVKYRQIYSEKTAGEAGGTKYKPVSSYSSLSNYCLNPEDLVVDSETTSEGSQSEDDLPKFLFQGKSYSPPSTRHWTVKIDSLYRVDKAGRMMPSKTRPRYIRKLNDFSVIPMSNIWTDIGGIQSRTDPKIYVVQSATELIKRCVLMTTDPGDLVLDPTCGSGSTAYVAEQWGRRWITIDTSRVSLALARARIMGARYPYYFLTDSPEGQQKEAEVTRSVPSTQPANGNIRHGFVYERVPHITLKSIANNTEIDVIWDRFQEKLEPLREQLNQSLGKNWQEWEMPREVEAKWSDAAKKLHADWWSARIDRQKEIDASIAAKAEHEYLYDKPYEDKKKVRVAGPFTVESLSPHRVLTVGADDELIDTVAEAKDGYGQERDFVQMILENLKTAGVQQTHKEDKINFTALTPWPGDLICAEGRFEDAGGEKRAAIFIGPEFGTVSRPDLVSAAREAGDAGFDVLIACAFNYDAHSSEFDKLGRIPVLKARMNADLHMADDLKNTGKGNLFVIFGEPDIDIIDAEDGQVQVKVNGVDVFHPNTGEVRSDGAEGIACWFIDTDYNEESFFVRHAYFLGANDPYKALKTTLKAEINQDAWDTLNSDTSRPFDKPSTGRIAVKVINHLGDEVMKVFRV
ncbi:MAG: site-specific DNA-methyltransferase [Desulfuromonadales bacterium]|nr:site-specific DNA-methyltransferase [Desulfuromonadales bacterium]MDW7756183.1 site-specific DNA-methyltransferase [Desulfuromonadales bacterium]